MPPPPTKTALLLPASPTTSISAATAFWAPTITSAYTRLPSTQYSLLYIAVPAPFPTASRRASFTAAQELFTALYSLINDLGNPQVDVRIVLLSAVDAAFGPVMGFEQLADLQEWDLLLCPRHDTGYQLQGQFLASSGSPSIRINYVDVGDFTPGGDVPEVVAAEELNEEELEEHAIVAVGGTFDHLHLGHKLLLTCTAYMGAPTTSNTRLIVGLTGPEMLTNKKHVEQMETYESRAAQVLEFVRGIVDVTPFDCRGAISTQEEGEVLVATFKEWRGEDEEGEDEAKKLRVEISELKDPFGPTITEEGVTALVVTKETESGGAAVNRKREDRGWKTLEVGVVGLLMDRGAKLSSTELRRQAGEAAKKVALG